MGMDKDSAKDLTGSGSTLAPDTPFFTVAQQKGKDFAPKAEKKGKNKDKDKEGCKDKSTYARMMHFWHCLDVSACGVVFTNLCMTLHV